MKNQKMINDLSILSSEIAVFLVVYEQQSINAAARKLSQDPGNVSRTLAKLERSAGEKLFVRHKNGLTPKELGHRLYSAVVQSQKSFSERIQNKGEQKKIRIGFSSALGYSHFSYSMTNLLVEKILFLTLLLKALFGSLISSKSESLILHWSTTPFNFLD